MSEEDFIDEETPRRVLMLTQEADARFWRQARRLADDGYRVSAVCAGDAPDEEPEISGSVKIYRCGRKPGLARMFATACFLMAREGIDIIHACNPPEGVFALGSFFKFMFDTRYVFDHRVLSPELYEATRKKRGAGYYLTRLAELLNFKMADAVIAPNESFRQIARNRGGVDPEKIFIVRPAPDMARLKIAPPARDWRVGKKFLVAYAGVMGEAQGIGYLIEAVWHIVQDMKRGNIRFALAGRGEARDKYLELVREKGLDAHVSFVDVLSEQSLLDMLNAADLCVSPDEVNPANDKATIERVAEYMALGKPMVQFAMTEGMFSAGNAALYARPNDAGDLAEKIIELIDDPQKAASLGALGRMRVERDLTWAREAPRLLAAYDYVFADKNAKPVLRLAAN